jgi:hypothetical protein
MVITAAKAVLDRDFRARLIELYVDFVEAGRKGSGQRAGR